MTASLGRGEFLADKGKGELRAGTGELRAGLGDPDGDWDNLAFFLFSLSNA